MRPTSFESESVVSVPAWSPAAPVAQVALDFEAQSYDVSVDVKLYFNYLKASDKFHAKRSENAVRCLLSETCHRRRVCLSSLALTIEPIPLAAIHRFFFSVCVSVCVCFYY